MMDLAVSYYRITKAEKIDAVPCDYLAVVRIEGKSILDLGSGSGHIAEHFARKNHVIAADGVDQITVTTRSAILIPGVPTR